jgi:hypothetical protein
MDKIAEFVRYFTGANSYSWDGTVEAVPTMTKPDDVARIVALFRARSAFWTQQGFHGALLYERLAADTELPENLSPAVIAELEGIQPSAIAQRRKRGQGSSFLRTAQNAVLYPLKRPGCREAPGDERQENWLSWG